MKIENLRLEGIWQELQRQCSGRCDATKEIWDGTDILVYSYMLQYMRRREKDL